MKSRKSTDLLFPLFSDGQGRMDRLHSFWLMDREALCEPAELLL